MPFRGNRIFVVGELMIVCGLLALELKDAPGLLLVFPLGWISLGLRKLGWHGVGLRRPAKWPRTLGLGVLIGIITQLIAMWLIDPWLVRLTGQPFNIEQFDASAGEPPKPNGLDPNRLAVGCIPGGVGISRVLTKPLHRPTWR